MPDYGDDQYGVGKYGEDDTPPTAGLLAALAAQSLATSTTALTKDEANIVMQAVTCACLGIDPGAAVAPGAANPFSLVRVEYPAQGQPAWLQAEDVCFVRMVPLSDQYTETRDERVGLDLYGALQAQHLYSRSWSCRWTFYGPNSLDRCRSLKTAILSDLAGDTLAQSSLYVLPDIPEPTRAPELFQGAWWERVDLSARLYEGVQDTNPTTTSTSVELQTIMATRTSDVVISAGDPE